MRIEQEYNVSNVQSAIIRRLSGAIRGKRLKFSRAGPRRNIEKLDDHRDWITMGCSWGGR